MHLKRDCLDGSVLNGVRQQVLYSFVLVKPLGNKVFSESETVHYNNINKSVSNTVTF